MLCYECLTQDKREMPAAAICSQCGAAVCSAHTRIGHAYTEVHSPGSQVREAPGRRLYCATCGTDLSPAEHMAEAGFTEG